MSKATNYLETQIINFWLFGTPFVPPADVYVGLLTAFASDGATFTEVSTVGTGYARQIAAFDAPSGGSTANSGVITYPVATAPYGTVSHFGIFDAPVAGNMLYWDDLPAPVTVNTGEQFSFAVGDIDVSWRLSGFGSVYAGDRNINMTLRGIVVTPPVSRFLGLLTAFTDDATFTEVTDAGYARQNVSTVFDVPVNGVTQNNANVVFGNAAVAYTVTHDAVFDAVTLGNMIYRGPYGVPLLVEIGKHVQYNVGTLVRRNE